MMDDSSKIWRLYTEAQSADNNPEDETPTWPDIGDIDKDFEKHSSNFPHGHAYPNRKLSYDKVVELNSIYGVSETNVEEFSRKHLRSVYTYVKKHMPWLSLYDTETGYYGPDKLDDYIKEESSSALTALIDAINRRTKTFEHWAHVTDAEMETLKSESWRVEARQKALAILKKYPDAVDQIEKFKQYEQFLNQEDPNNPEYESNYPLYVTLYDLSRHLGGSEEGGWWYDSYDMVNGFRVKSYAEAEKAAKILYNSIPRADLDGQPIICLEYKKGSRVTTERPDYE